MGGDYSQRHRTWIPGVVLSVTGPVSYVCSTDSGERPCHVDQLMPRWEQRNGQQERSEACRESEQTATADTSGTPATEPAEVDRDTPCEIEPAAMPEQSEVTVRRSERSRRPPDRWSY